MKYCVVRGYFKNGNENDPIEQTYSKNFDTFEKALNLGERYTKGLRFYNYTICDAETMNSLYTRDYEGNTEDFRTE